METLPPINQALIAEEPRYTQELRTEYDKIKNNFLKEIRQKLLLFDQTLAQCEMNCKAGCVKNYTNNVINRPPLEIEGGMPPPELTPTPEQSSLEQSPSPEQSPRSIWDSLKSKVEDFSTRVRQGSTSNSNDDTSDDDDAKSVASDDSNTVFANAIKYMKGKIAEANGERPYVDPKEVCDKFFKTVDNRDSRHGLPEVCSLPNRMSDEGTQAICKEAIRSRIEITNLITMYKSDTKAEAASVAKQKADFLQLVRGTSRGGSKKTKKRRQRRHK